MKMYSMDNCPWCELLKLRLDHKGIAYEEIKDEKIIAEKGFDTVPRLEIEEGKVLDFNKAILWVNAYNTVTGEPNE